MPDIVILRHGNTFDPGDVIRRIGAGTDLPLSVSGRAQAASVSAALKTDGWRFTRIFAAPLKRTMETASAVRDACAPDVSIEPLAALKEVHYGPDEGRPESDVVERLGDRALAAWERAGDVPAGWRIDAGQIISTWRAFFADCATESGPILAVTSNGVARYACDGADDAPAWAARKLNTAAYGIVKVGTGGENSIVAWNVRPPKLA